MSNISTVASEAYAYTNGTNPVTEKEKSAETQRSGGASDKRPVGGKTIGKPELSEKAAKYYESLKKKYSNMDFILVSEDQKEQAKAQAGSYANPNKMVVLIDEDKIEKMAEDENYRKQYEGVIQNAASGLSQLGSQLASSGANVKGYGMQVSDDGTASYFAVLEKSSEAQKERIEKNAVKKKEAQKAEDKKAHKQEQQERLEKSRNKNKTESKTEGKDDESVVITASSIEELIQKVQDQTQLFMSDSVQTEDEKKVGSNFDFSV